MLTPEQYEHKPSDQAVCNKCRVSSTAHDCHASMGYTKRHTCSIALLQTPFLSCHIRAALRSVPTKARLLDPREVPQAVAVDQQAPRLTAQGQAPTGQAPAPLEVVPSKQRETAPLEVVPSE